MTAGKRLSVRAGTARTGIATVEFYEFGCAEN
jgi:hypothetical protein